MLLLPVMAVALETNARKMAGFEDGETFYVKSEEKSKPILAPNGVTVSPNLGYVKANSNVKSRVMASVRMHADSMIVTYKHAYNDQIFKIERYLYNPSKDALSLEGEQVYLHNNIPYCCEVIANGLLKRVIWYDTQGRKERIYMFKGQDISELQLYPNGKICIRTEHFGTPEAVQTVYDAEGHEASWTTASLAGEPDSFDAFFNRNFRCDRLYTKGAFQLYITVESDGTFSALVFAHEGTFLTRMEGAGLPLWTPAAINGTPVRSSLFRYVSYNPMEYLSSKDTLPMHCMQTYNSVYNGIKWVDSKIYSFIPADTCSQQGTMEENGDTIILYCFDKQSGEMVTRQSYVENEYGKKIKEGWFTYYMNNNKSYQELYVNDTVSRTIHYYENEAPKMAVVREKNRTRAVWDSLYSYYPNGQLKMVAVPDGENDIYTYYDKQGKPTEDIVFPEYPGKEKALNKYLWKHMQLIGSKVWQQKSWNSIDCWVNFFVEVDENGKVLNMGKGAASLSQNYKLTPLSRTEIDQLYDLIKDCLMSNPTPWIPGKIQGEPTTLRTKVRVKYSYAR